jgi:hypothetical protein
MLRYRCRVVLQLFKRGWKKGFVVRRNATKHKLDIACIDLGFPVLWEAGEPFDPTEFCLAVFVVLKWICNFSSHVLQFVEADGIPVGTIVVDLLHSWESQRIMPGVGRLVEPGAHHLDDEWIFEEFCCPERLTLVQLDVELGSGESKRQLAKFPPLIKIEDVLLRDIISIDRVHNPEFRLHIKPTNIVFIFETAKVESRPGQLTDTKFGHIFRIASPADNSQICGITEAPDIIFFHLDIPIRPVKQDTKG